MADQKAKMIIQMQEKALADQSNFRTLWQDTADFQFPRMNQIVDTQTPGQQKMNNVFNNTAIGASQDMASGLSSTMIPAGEKFFELKSADDELNEQDFTSQYFSRATDIAHNEMFESNFMMQLNETLRSLVVFGTGNLYVERGKKTSLNFRDYDISQYQILENSDGLVDTVMRRFPWTARQAVQEWGEENVGPLVKDAYDKEDSRNKMFEFIHLVRPREERDITSPVATEMAFESVVVGIKDQNIIEESGFQEMPYNVARWMKSSNETHGRGQGTEILPTVRVVNRMDADLMECANKHNNPPLEISGDIDGEVRLTPGAMNYTQKQGSINAIRSAALGNFPISKDILEAKEESVRKAYFVDVFVQLTNLKGDRRTRLEISERLREGLRRLSLPVARMQAELFNPLITRVVNILIRNGVIPPPPPELQKKGFKIEYVGPLALALRNQQFRGTQEWVAFTAEMEAVFPGSIDNVDSDEVVRFGGRALGVKASFIRSEADRDELRAQRAQKQQQQQLAELAASAADSYNKTSSTAEPGSPASEIQGVLAGAT